jgi:hypothetical protein
MKRYSLVHLDSFLHDPPEKFKRDPRSEEFRASSDRPGDVFNETFSVGTVLEWLGFEVSHSDGQGEHWVRPGKSARDGSSVTVYDDDTGQHATVWSDTVTGWYPAMEVRRPYDAFGLFTVTHHDGDFAAANQALIAEGFGEPRDDGGMLAFLAGIEADIAGERELEANTREPTSWAPMDGRAFLAGNPEPPPDLFRREDGVFLLYRGQVNIFMGEPESAKSWGAQVALVECIAAGGRACMIDFENSNTAVRDRLLALQLPEKYMDRGGRFDYIRPQVPLVAFTYEHEDLLAAASKNYDIIVIDGVTDGMSLQGLDPMNNMDASTFDRLLYKPLAATGAAVVVIDHVTKSREGRGDWAIGAQAKKAATTGASYGFEKVHEFGRGMIGMSRLIVAKDKPGYVRPKSVGNKIIAEFWLDASVEGVMTPSLKVPTSASQVVQASPALMALLSEYIGANPARKRATIYTSCGSTVKREYVAAAFDELRVNGYIQSELGKPDAWHSLKPYVASPPGDWTDL